MDLPGGSASNWEGARRDDAPLLLAPTSIRRSGNTDNSPSWCLFSLANGRDGRDQDGCGKVKSVEYNSPRQKRHDVVLIYNTEAQ